MAFDRAVRMVDVGLKEAAITFDLPEVTEKEIEAAEKEIEELEK